MQALDLIVIDLQLTENRDRVLAQDHLVRKDLAIGQRRSSLMTRAPMSASIIVQKGPDNARVRWKTTTPLSGPVEDMRAPL